MTAVKQRIPLAEAEGLAQEVVTLLAPYCARCEVAGSIRRRRPDVGDLEILAIPKIRNDGSADLFGDIPAEVNELDERVTQLLVTGEFGRRLDKNGHSAVGSKYKRLTYRDFGLDLFVVLPPAWSYGLALVIRTGPADFSHQLVTPRNATLTDSQGKSRSGLLPPWFQVHDFGIYYRDGRTDLVPTPEESDVFEALKLDWIEPAARA